MKLFQKYPIALLALSVALAGASQADGDIIDGDVVAKGDPLAEFTVLVRNHDQDPGGPAYGLCSGTLIAPRIVLTAAHCVLSPSDRLVRGAEKISVVFNDFHTERLDDVSVGITADKVIAHGEYFENGVVPGGGRQVYYHLLNFSTYDIALIRLEKDAPAGFTPLEKIASRREIDTYADSLIAVGYGNELATDEALSGRLKSARVNLESNHPFYSYIDGSYGNGMIMSGDSGGPLLIKHPTQGYKLAGVHSTSTKPAEYKTDNFTSVRVDAYEAFIKKGLTSMGADPNRIYGNPVPTPKSGGSRWPRFGG